jgi:hypothetical protein
LHDAAVHGISAAGERNDHLGFSALVSDCEPGYVIMCSARDDRAAEGASPLSDRTYATISHTCDAGIFPANEGMPLGRPSTIVV